MASGRVVFGTFRFLVLFSGRCKGWISYDSSLINLKPLSCIKHSAIWVDICQRSPTDSPAKA